MERFERGMFADSYSCLTMIANWVESLHEEGSITESLTMLLRLVGARSSTLSRFDTVAPNGRALLYVDPMDGNVPAPGKAPIMARILLGSQVQFVKPGRLFMARDLADTSSDPLEKLEFLASHQLADIAIISLGCRNECAEFLEIHIAQESNANMGLLTLFPHVLAKTWEKRSLGLTALLHKEKLANRLGGRVDVANIHLLDADNPAGLSRTEFKICMHMQDGKSVKKIAAVQEISESTVRSHLRSIYAKTETSGQLELLHKLTTVSGVHEDALSA